MEEDIRHASWSTVMSLSVLRRSGALVTHCVYKTGPDMSSQGRVMMANPEAYAPVLATTQDGYIMPVLYHLVSAAQLEQALTTLLQLWNIGLRAHSGTLPNRKHYHDYVMSKNASSLLLDCADRWFLRTREEKGILASRIHGDATVENIMLHENKPMWIDPCVRRVPFEVELDCGKLLQSFHGYHDMPAGSREAISRFMAYLPCTQSLIKYYLASHLVRLWEHQPAHHSWATGVAEGALCG